MNTKAKKNLMKLVITAMFLSLSVISDLFISIDIPLFGIKGKELSTAGIFTAFPAILFGPWFGGIASGLTDLISYLFKPQGAYIPWLTVIAFIGGFIKGAIWIFIKNVKNINVRTFVLVLLIITGVFGVFNHITILNDGLSTKIVSNENSVLNKETIDNMIENHELSGISLAAIKLTKYSKIANFEADLAKYINFMTIAFEIIAVMGIVFYLIDYSLEKKERRKETGLHVGYMKILLILLIPSIIVTTLNTQILIWFISVLNGRSFFIVWIPRIIPAIISTTIQAYFVAILYDVYLKHIKNKILI